MYSIGMNFNDNALKMLERNLQRNNIILKIVKEK